MGKASRRKRKRLSQTHSTAMDNPTWHKDASDHNPSIEPQYGVRTAEKPIGIWLSLAAIVVGIVFWIMEKTSTAIGASLVLIVMLLVIPVLKFWWIEETKVRQISALMILATSLAIFGYSHWPEVLSNGELCKDAKTFAQRMRDFHHERQLQKDTVEKDYRRKNEIARIESEKEQLWREYRAFDDRWHNDYSYDYENKLRPVAISLRDQLLARLPSLLPQTADSQLMDDASFYNVGAFGTPRAADRLEAYARMLCPTPTST